MKSPSKDLIDAIWPSAERPPAPNTKIEIHDIKYAGRYFLEYVPEPSEVKIFPEYLVSRTSCKRIVKNLNKNTAP